jgi:hypothetical protein
MRDGNDLCPRCASIVTPPSFSGRPGIVVIQQAMYVPEVRANGDEVRVVVVERR